MIRSMSPFGTKGTCGAGLTMSAVEGGTDINSDRAEVPTNDGGRLRSSSPVRYPGKTCSPGDVTRRARTWGRQCLRKKTPEVVSDFLGHETPPKPWAVIRAASDRTEPTDTRTIPELR